MLLFSRCSRFWENFGRRSQASIAKESLTLDQVVVCSWIHHTLWTISEAATITNSRHPSTRRCRLKSTQYHRPPYSGSRCASIQSSPQPVGTRTFTQAPIAISSMNNFVASATQSSTSQATTTSYLSIWTMSVYPQDTTSGS